MEFQIYLNAGKANCQKTYLHFHTNLTIWKCNFKGCVRGTEKKRASPKGPGQVQKKKWSVLSVMLLLSNPASLSGPLHFLTLSIWVDTLYTTSFFFFIAETVWGHFSALAQEVFYWMCHLCETELSFSPWMKLKGRFPLYMEKICDASGSYLRQYVCLTWWYNGRLGCPKKRNFFPIIFVNWPIVP